MFVVCCFFSGVWREKVVPKKRVALRMMEGILHVFLCWVQANLLVLNLRKTFIKTPSKSTPGFLLVENFEGKTFEDFGDQKLEGKR